MADKGKTTDQEVMATWVSMEVRQRGEIAESVASFCVGRSVQQVATLLGKPESYVTEQLDRSAVEEAMNWVRKQESNSVKTTTVDDILKGIESFVRMEPDWECLWDYERRGHATEVARRLARINHAAWDAMHRMGVVDS